MATYNLVGTQSYYGGSTYDPDKYYYKAKATVVITDYADHIEGYVDTYVAGWKNYSGTLNLNGTFKLSIGGTNYSETISAYVTQTNQEVNKTALARKTFRVNKTHSTQTLAFSISYTDNYLTGASPRTSSASYNYSVSAKTNYVVTLNANGGNPDWTMTKWYGENLSLSPNTPPVLNGYVLIGWATTTAKASNGEVDYAVGGTYSTNSATTLYAVWELAYTKPAISSYSVERCQANGDSDDEGGYAKVIVDWSIYQTNLPRFYGGSVYPYASNSVSCVIQVGSYSETITSLNASGTFSEVVGNGSFSTDSQYSVTITLTDTQSVKSGNSVTVNGALATSFFPMDFNADGTTLGIFRPAPDNPNGTDDGIYLGKDLFLPLDTTAGSGADYEIYTALTNLGWTDVLVNI